MMKKLLKPLVTLIWSTVLFLAVWLAGTYANLPLWLSLLAGTVAVVLALSGRRILLALRRAGETRKLRATAFLDKKAERVLSISGIFKAANALIRKSSSRKNGIKASELPFFLLLGNSGSGKTTALRQADVPIRFKSDPGPKNRQATETVDFVFEDKAIFLDTSGRYVHTGQSPETGEEWELIVSLLNRTRRMEPFNGVVVTVSIEDLLATDPVDLSKLSQNIRQRIDSLMRSAGARFPVYIMVTKLDLLAGFREWLLPLAETRSHELLGTLENNQEEWRAFLSRAMDTVVEKIRVTSFVESDSEIETPENLVFSREVQALEAPLEVFLKGLFEPSPYLAHPLLRGLFFSSAEIRPWAFSSVLGAPLHDRPAPEAELVERPAATSSPRKSLGVADTPLLLTGQEFPAMAPVRPRKRIPKLPSVGVFLKDFFATLLPMEKGLYQPGGILTRWKRYSSNVPLVGWYGANLVAVVYLSYSFFAIHHVFGVLESRSPDKIQMGRDFHQNLENMERYRGLIDWMARKDHSESFHLLAFTGSVDGIEDRMKTQFTNRFDQYLLPDMNAMLKKKIRRLEVDDPDHKLADYASIVVRRINLIRGKQSGDGWTTLKALPTPGVRDLVAIDSSISREEARHFSDLVLADIAWGENGAENRNLDFLESLLLEVEQSAPDFHWLVDWVNSQDMPGVTLSDFWKGGRKLRESAEIQPAYTLAGMNKIFSFMEEIQNASPRNFDVKGHRDLFLTWYKNRKEQAWLRFVHHFSDGEDTLSDAIQWKAVFHTLPGPENPYRKLVVRILSEFPESKTETAPGWLVTVRNIDRVERSGSSGTLVSRISGYARILNDSGHQATHRGARRGHQYFVSMISAVKAYGVYRQSMDAIVKEALQGRGHAYALSAAYYGFRRSSSNKPPLLVTASESMKEIRQSIVDPSDPDALIVWTLLSGELDTAFDFTDREAACEIQDRWNGNVVLPSQASLTRTDLDRFLLAPSGAIPEFVSKTLSPFVQKSANGYRLIWRDGHQMAIVPQFMVFLNNAILGRRSLQIANKKFLLEQEKRHLDLVTLRQSLKKEQTIDTDRILAISKKQYPITVRALPTDVNHHATVRPFLTRLTLHCARNTYVLNNYNLPVRNAWNWSPLVCGTTTLEIRIGSLTLERIYAGKTGFVDFLNAFYQGHHRFTPEEFPLYTGALRNLGISRIDVQFHFKGAQNLLAQYREYTLARESRKRTRDKIRQIDSELAILDQNDLQSKSGALKSQPFGASTLPGKIADCLPGESESVGTGGSAQPDQQPPLSDKGA